MCHEKHHRDPDLVAVANAICGVGSATLPSTREYSLTAARLLLDAASCVGLQEFLQDPSPTMTSGDRDRFRVRIMSIRQRIAQQALEAMALAEANVPF